VGDYCGLVFRNGHVIGSESVITAKMCSNVEHCIVNHGAIERIQGCLLQTLTG
jgi:hypothetical protein